MLSSPWNYCLERLEGELTPQQFNTWIRPLQAEERGTSVLLLAPNRFVKDWVHERYFEKITDILSKNAAYSQFSLSLEVGCQNTSVKQEETKTQQKNTTKAPHTSNLNPGFTFNSFVEGKSNQLAKAASIQVAKNPGTSYNPLFIYGGVGMGKTHLMHAIGHE
ncbi:MAG: chromosomal replication initiator protein DnaA, partial [Gammaproteobacteria bacterium]